MKKDKLIRLKDVSLTVKANSKSINILNKINLNINEAETISVVGPSGAGKTSLIMLIAGLQKPSSGHIIIDNKSIESMSEDALAVFRRSHVGIVFQNYFLIPSMSALENVMIPLELAKVENARDKAYETLKLLGLSKRVDHFPSQLSGGEQQRVAIARAFAARPKIILADEPTGNLDSATGQIVMDELFELNKKFRTTFVLITHDSKIAKKCSRSIKILDGKIDESHK